MSRLAQAFKANIVPAIFLWSVAFGILYFYSHNAAVHAGLTAVADLKSRLGLGFSMPAQAVAAGLIPFLLQKLQAGNHGRTRLVHVPFLMLFFAFQGGLSDLFYTMQAHIFGNGVGWAQVLPKIAVDLGFYSPVICMPSQTWAYVFKDNGFSWARTREALGPNWYARRVFPVYLACLLVWMPALAVLYSLPLPLQFPFQAIIQCFWGLILIIVTKGAEGEIATGIEGGAGPSVAAESVG